jgi:hypothetical protein
MDHVAAQLRATRAEREAKAAFTAGLEAQGIAIYGDRPYVPWTLALENLRNGDGNPISPQAHATCPGRAVTITYDWDWAPGAEAAYRAAHNLAGDDDLAGVEFSSDEEAREAGFVPGWRVGRHLCTDPGQYGHANVHGTPGGTPTPCRSADIRSCNGDRRAALDPATTRHKLGRCDRHCALLTGREARRRIYPNRRSPCQAGCWPKSKYRVRWMTRWPRPSSAPRIMPR